ncbi:MAG: NAD(P)H-dependent oxidoreductase [Oligoflexales bacterium]|nr:NAD(P)H-dependent oxidoreductase [Oligoflexales bacterium]
MKITILSGSQRQNSNSAKVGSFAETYFNTGGAVETFHLKLENHPLPLWDDQISDSQLEEIWKPIHSELSSSDALVVITPEWHGMASPALKNFFLYCDSKCIAHKPALLISVSAGIAGSYPINEMRTSSYKNSRICYIPDHLIIRNASNFCKQYQDPQDQLIKDAVKRFHYSLEVLKVYAEAFTQIRASESIAIDQFPNGL